MQPENAGSERTMAIEQRLMTANDLARLPRGRERHELVRGELRTMAPPGYEHGNVAARIGYPLAAYVTAHGLGEVPFGEIGFRLTTDPDTVRAPDVAFIRAERLKGVGPVRGYFPGAPDLAIEVISPNDVYAEVDDKVDEWLEHVTPLVFVVNPRRCSVMVYRPDRVVRLLSTADTLDGEDVVPGWTLPIADLFA